MITIKKPFYVDVDDTLILWDISKYQDDLPDEDLITFKCNDITMHVYIHQKNVNTVLKLWKMGYSIIVHSQTGHEYVKAVVDAIGITDCITAIGDKPSFYLDDLPANAWMKRTYRDPITGEETGCYGKELE